MKIIYLLLCLPYLALADTAAPPQKDLVALKPKILETNAKGIRIQKEGLKILEAGQVCLNSATTKETISACLEKMKNDTNALKAQAAK